MPQDVRLVMAAPQGALQSTNCTVNEFGDKYRTHGQKNEETKLT